MRYAERMGVMLALAASAGAATGGEAKLDWFAGHWCGERDGTRIEEAWLPEAGGSLLWMSRTLKDGRAASFEFMRIVSEDGIPQLRVQPGGAAEVAFTRSAAGDGWIRFDNPANDFPTRIEYRREGDALHAFIAGPGRDGTDVRIPYDYRRCGR